MVNISKITDPNSALLVTEDEREKVNKVLLTKTESEIEECLRSVKEWIKKQAHLPQNEDEKILFRMLMLNKFSVEKTKTKLEFYYTGKHFLSEYFENNHPLHPEIQKTMTYHFVLPIPNLTNNCERIILFRSHANADEYNPISWLRYTLSVFETRIMNDWCSADILLIDFQQLTLGYVLKVPPMGIKNVLSFLTNAFSDRIKNIHCLNMPSYAESIISVVKATLKNKMAERVLIHKNLESLYKYIPKKYLPKDYGGDLKELSELQANWKKFMENQNAWFLERRQMKSNEKLRVGEPIKSELFGIQGSFRKLNID